MIASIMLMPGAWGGGVTLITHGFNGNVDDWVIPMGESILNHPSFEGGGLTCYEIVVTSGGAGLQYSAMRIGGPAGDEVASGEIIVKLNWSSVAEGSVSTGQVASVAAAALRDTALLSELDGRALAELPIHLIGHSRGASVISEMSRFLGEGGIWVDQVSFLDQVPVGLFSDATVRVWENVLFGDNYWQRLGNFFEPKGNSVSGTYGRQLTSLGGGYGSPHSDVHLWYHGTIDPATPLTIDGASITASERSSWWAAGEASGANAGFLFSRIGGGDRTSTVEPTGVDAIRDGLNQIFDFGAGLSSNRVLLSGKSDVWPNLITANRNGIDPVEEGDSFDLDLSYQTGASAVDPELTVLLDVDGNPWNANETDLGTADLTDSGTSQVLFSTESASTGGVAPGTYKVLLKLSQGGRIRYLYTAESVEIVSSSQPGIVAGSAGITGGLFGFMVEGPEGTSVNIEASIDMLSWGVIATQSLSASPWQFSDPDTGSYGRRFYRIAE